MTSRQKLRRALMDLNQPRHERAVEWVHEPSSFKTRVRRPVRVPYKHVKRRSYRPDRKPKQPGALAELLCAVAAVVTAAVIIARF